MTVEDIDQILGPRSNSRPAWCLFDHEWYLQAYADVRPALADDAFATVRQFYLDHGRTLLHAPNMFFDERWYLQRYPDVAEEVIQGDYGSGYEQYCAIGYLTRSPHFLYDDDIYAQNSRDLTDQALVELDCFNRYDHYIKSGAADLRAAHLLFDPALYRAAIEQDGEGAVPIDAAGPFEHFLQRIWYERLDARTAIYFDQAWYLDRYEEARAAIQRGEYVCALQHYLTAPDQGSRDPLPAFSEIFYQDRFPDVAAGVRQAAFLSGYEHFLKSGVFDLRDPSAEIDLAAFAERRTTLARDMAAGVVRDAFAELLLHGVEGSAQAEVPAISGHGRIDFLGYQTAAHGWFFCGWVVPEHVALDGRVQAAAYFEQGSVTAPALVCSYLRDDLGGSGTGLVLFVEGPGRPMGNLISLNIAAEGVAWTLFPGDNAPMLRDGELAVPLRPVLGRLRGNASKGALVALAARRGYTGSNTLGELQDRVFVEIDETVFCPPHGVLLIGWMLAQPGVVQTIRLHSGARDMVLQSENFLRIARQDVLDSVGAQHGFQELRCGFILYAPNVYTPGDLSYLSIETARGELGFRGLTEPRQQGMPAIRFLLDRIDLRYDELVRAYDHVIGPAVASLNRQRLADKAPPDVIAFGRAAEAPVLSVVVPLYGRLDFLEHQLAQFSRHRPAIAHEFIYVLDNPQQQRDAERLAASVFARFAIPFRLVALSHNLGYAPANNVGIELARGRYVCLLNSDVFPDTADWMERLVARLQDNPGLGAIGPLLLFEDRSVQHQGMAFEALAEFGGWLFPRHERKGWKPPAQRGLHRSLAITGACLVMERRLLRELGGLDESFAIGDFEDADLCMKIAERGLDCAVDLDVTMFHLERQSQAGSEQRWRMNLTLYNAWVHDGRWSTRLRERMAPVPAAGEPARPALAAPEAAARPERLSRDSARSRKTRPAAATGPLP